jgi:hypothetical protein
VTAVTAGIVAVGYGHLGSWGHAALQDARASIMRDALRTAALLGIVIVVASIVVVCALAGSTLAIGIATALDQEEFISFDNNGEIESTFTCEVTRTAICR